jgi:hypothetical protein
VCAEKLAPGTAGLQESNSLPTACASRETLAAIGRAADEPPIRIAAVGFFGFAAMP